MDRFLVALAAFIGGLLMALTGFLDTKDPVTGKREPFDWRKFGSSIIRSVFAAIIFAVGYQLIGKIDALAFLYAVLGGAGFDVGLNRISGALGNGSWPLPLPKPNARPN